MLRNLHANMHYLQFEQNICQDTFIYTEENKKFFVILLSNAVLWKIVKILNDL